MRVLSLFDGISCARQALYNLGIPVHTYYASEIDKYAIQISKNRWLEIVQIGNVQDINTAEYTNIDLLIGGSPCQDLSIAKTNRKGLQGDRSGLFWEYVRILKEVKPRYFVLENVASMPKVDKQIITNTLGVEPIMIDAALVSGQQRKRLFWTNIPNVTLPQDSGILLKDILEHGEVDRDKAYCIDANYYKGANWNQYKSKGRRQLVMVGSINKSQSGRVYDISGKSVSLQANGGGAGAKTGLYIKPVALRNRGNGKKPEYNKSGKANSLTTVQSDSMVAHLDDDKYIIRKLTPVECERLQSLPDGYTEGVSNTQRYKALGNAFNVNVVAHILSFMEL